jgi:dsDNA-specific endonuclease/ATPase MutS2
MNQPTIEQFDQLQKQYYALVQRVDRLDQAEKKHDFTIRDSSVKIGIAEGLAESTHKEVSQLKLEMIQVRAEVKELRHSTDQQFEDIRERLDRQEVMLKESHNELTKKLQESHDELTKKLDMVLRFLNQGYSE